MRINVYMSYMMILYETHFEILAEVFFSLANFCSRRASRAARLYLCYTGGITSASYLSLPLPPLLYHSCALCCVRIATANTSTDWVMAFGPHNNKNGYHNRSDEQLVEWNTRAAQICK